MDELDFTSAVPAKPVAAAEAARPVHDGAAARRFFALRGEEGEAAAGEVIFSEDEKGNRLLLQRDKMYLLLEGEVALSVRRQPVGVVRAGEIFGELASITHSARSATATAATHCRYLALDDRQFGESLQQQPEFALVMLAVMAERVRAMLEHMQSSGIKPGEHGGREAAALDRTMLKRLREAAGEKACISFPAHKPIMEEGGAGVYMYVVLEGEVGIYIQDNLVELVGPGGLFGEMALAGRTQRLASAEAESACELLALNRNVFVDLVRRDPQFGIALIDAVGARARYMTEQR